MKLRYIKIYGPRPPHAHTFLYRTNPSGVKRYVVDVWQGFEYASGSQYVRVLNIPVLIIPVSNTSE